MNPATARAASTFHQSSLEAVVAAAAGECSLPADEVRGALFADLKAQHVLTRFDAISGPALVAYETAQQQAILLRAVRVVVTFEADVRWGPERLPLAFQLEGEPQGESPATRGCPTRWRGCATVSAP